MSTEPVAIGAAIIAFCNAVLGVAALVIDSMSPELVGGLNLVIVSAVGLVGAVVRSRVTPVETEHTNPDVRSYYE